MRFRTAAVSGLLLAGIACAAAPEEGAASVSMQRPRGPKVLSIEVTARSVNGSGWDGTVELVASIDPQFHINSNEPSSEFLIPTSVKFKANPAVTLGPTQYPKGILKSFAFSENEKLSIYEGRTSIRVPYRLEKAPGDAPVVLQGVLSYQACTNEACLPPRSDEFELTLKGAR